MRNSSLRIPYGEHQGKLLHISEVPQGLACECVCPACQEPLVARKGEKTKHHFAHYPGANCSAETVLHQLGKRLLYGRISSAIANGQSLPIMWQCLYCYDQHDGNLVKLATTVVMEKTFGRCRPDLTILKENGQPVAILEVVVSHKPDDNVLAYVAEQSATLVEFHVDSYDDIETLGQASILKPTKVTLCPKPKCLQCARPLDAKILHVVDGTCWKCTATMKIALLCIEGMLMGPENFSKKEIQLARQLGAILKVNYSRTAQREYLSSTCGGCGAFSGSFYLHEYTDLMIPQTGHQTGYMCLECERYY